MYSRKTKFSKCVPAESSESSFTGFKARLGELINQSKDYGRHLEDLEPGNSAYTEGVKEEEYDEMDIAASEEDDEDTESYGDYENEEYDEDLVFRPITFERRVVLRPNVEVPVKIMVALQKMYKGEQAIANEFYGVLNAHVDDRHKKHMRRNLTRTSEEKLKMASQFTGIFPTDVGLEIAAQELLEQFYREHGHPNEAEATMLAGIAQRPLNIIRGWFRAKESRMVAPLRTEREHKVAALRPMVPTTAWKPQKPSTRH